MSKDARLAAGIRPVAVILFTGAWVAAHGLRPLTYGNHNTYLVRGLAAGGYADLSADPLLSSPDPAWIFSTLVEAAWRLAGSIGLSLLFSLFALPYVLSLLLLAVQAAGRDAGRHDRDARDDRWLLVIAAGLVVLHSRALDMVPAVGDGLAVG
ncbi:MAG: hypothetical protein KC583_23020, partial [Myxococcales bacterium]|nr:hypothetical protein [Myxococcales bacterium]